MEANSFDLMGLVTKLLNVQEAQYSTSQTAEALKERIATLFEQTGVSLEGRLTGEREFIAQDKLIVIGWAVPNLKRKSAYLEGSFAPTDTGTLIKLKTHPNSVLPTFALISALIGSVLTGIALLDPQVDSLYLIFGLVFVVLGVLYYPLSTFFTNRLQKKIVKQLGLTSE